MSGEKTERATPRKRQEIRKEGETVKSIDLINCFTLIAAILIIKVFGNYILVKVMYYFKNSLATCSNYTLLDINTVGYLFYDSFKVLFAVCSPFMFGIIIIGFIANFVQVGFLFTPKGIIAKGSRINPLEGAKRLFSKKAVFEMLKMTMKICVISIIAYISIKGILPTLAFSINYDLYNSIKQLFNIILDISFNIIIGLVIISVIDYIFQRYEFEKRIKMTKQEVKEEIKKTEGDPLIKANIRSKQMQMTRLRMMHDVPKADVVITNPTHYAVALKYDIGKKKAPYVLAKGQNLVAEKIKLIAKENDVPLVENKNLAQTLYKTVEIGEEIPFEMFQAIAEILAYIYRMKKKL